MFTRNMDDDIFQEENLSYAFTRINGGWHIS